MVGEAAVDSPYESMEQQMATPENFVELRGDCPRDVIDVIDAISGARNQSRLVLVNQILAEWVERRLHEHQSISRVRRVNPEVPARGGRSSEGSAS